MRWVIVTYGRGSHHRFDAANDRIQAFHCPVASAKSPPSLGQELHHESVQGNPFSLGTVHEPAVE